MSNTAVSVTGLSKRYRLGTTHAQDGSLAGALTRGLRRLIGGQPASPQTHDTLWALRDVSFEIKKGEVFGVIGTNGSGKSTLLKILSRVTEPTKGRALIHGRFCGLLEVGTGFHPELTGRDNVFMSGAILGMKRQEIARKFDEIVAFAEVEQFIDTPVKHYSSGMYVRLGFSVLAHMDPDILIVDEVLAVGDVRFQKKCMGKMEDVGQHGRTVILVSHDMPAITRMCSRAILLNKGEVVQAGPAHEVVNHYLQATAEPGRPRLRDAERAAGVYRGMTPLAAADVADVIAFIVNDRDPVWYRRPRPVGRYISTAWIPGNFLSEGTMIVGGGIFSEDPWHEHCDVPRAVGFRVVDPGTRDTARGDVTGRWEGVVRPLLRWTTEHSSL